MRGGKRLGAGRPKGAATRRSREIADRAITDGISPLEYMLTLMRDPEAAPARRDWAASAAAPYIHPRLAAVEQTGAGGGPIEIKPLLIQFSDPNAKDPGELSE